MDGKPHLGCEELGEAVGRTRPRVHVFGHIHGGYGERLSRDHNAAINILARAGPALLEGANHLQTGS